jgi:arginyl-tRNA synthetase
MATLKQILENLFKNAIITTLGNQHETVDPLIKPVTTSHFGDFQANFALSLAKKLGVKPTDLAQKIIENLPDSEVIEQIAVSGPGFINIQLSNSFLEKQLQALLKDNRLGIRQEKHTKPTVVEYGSPNVAKEMHVGHLRSTIIGDAISRILSFLGHQVIRQNHIGDWGTQFGMLIEYIYETGWQPNKQHSISEANALYKKAKQKFDADPDFADKSREQVVALQSGKEAALKIWQQLVAESELHFQDIYSRLNVLLTQEDVRGESFYNPALPEIVSELISKNIATLSEDAVVVFLEGFVDRDNNPIPFIIQKSGGGYLYASTDLAAVKFRLQNLHAQRIIYVVDARQAQHFAMLFATVRKATWIPSDVSLEHVAFGTVLGKDKKPFKTRSGDPVQLSTLLDEAEKRAYNIVKDKPNFTPEQKIFIARTIGIGALKYADLSTDRVKDYVFDWDRMLSFEGNTAPYLQNAYVRIQALFRRGSIVIDSLLDQDIIIEEDIERQLALKLLDFPEIIYFVAYELTPHRLCNYLYELASNYHKFYECCPVLSASETAIRHSRLLLSELTARTLHLGLNLLGIEVLDFM